MFKLKPVVHETTPVEIEKPEVDLNELFAKLIEEQKALNEALLKKFSELKFETSVNIEERTEFMLAMNRVNKNIEVTLTNFLRELSGVISTKPAVKVNVPEIKLPELKFPEPVKEKEFEWSHSITYDSEDRIKAIKSVKVYKHA